MAAILELDQFDRLPLWGQVLVASRMVRRGSLAFVDGGKFETSAEMHGKIMGACDLIERCAKDGEGPRAAATEMKAARRMRDVLPRDARAVGESLWWAVDAAEAAEAASDFPVDATVTNSVRASIGALASDPRVVGLQVTILFAGDFDLIRFACGEAGIDRYDGLSGYVFERVTPVHAIALVEPRINPEDLFR